MNRFAITLLLLIAIISVLPDRITSSASANVLPAQSETSTRRTDGEWIWMSKHNGRGIEVRIRGQIEFNESYTDVTSISRDGLLQVKDTRMGAERRLEITRSADGGLNRSYRVEGQSRSFDREASQWAAAVIQELVRQGGLDADKRVRQIYSQRGAEGVLDEISQINSSHVKRLYFEELFQISSLDAGTVRRILGQVARDMSSGYEKARVLMKVADRYLDDEATRSAYLNAVETIGSGYERGRVLSALLTKDNLSKQTLAQAVQAGMKISSSHEKAKILSQVAEKYSNDDVVLSAFFDALSTIDSSYERRRVLSALLKRSDLSRETIVRVFKSAQEISSDHEKGMILRSAAETHLEGDEIPSAFFDAAASINSSHERQRVLSALLTKNDLDKESLLRALKVASAISSDHEKARVLIRVAQFDSTDQTVRDALVEAAKTINSTHERGRVLSAIFK